MTLTSHPLWPELHRFVRIETYDRDGGHAHPRHRIEVDNPGRQLRAQFLAMHVPCVACGRSIHPIRQRRGATHLYIAVTCELSSSYACARGRQARDAYEEIVALAQQPLPEPPPRLPF